MNETRYPLITVRLDFEQPTAVVVGEARRAMKKARIPTDVIDSCTKSAYEAKDVEALKAALSNFVKVKEIRPRRNEFE